MNNLPLNLSVKDRYRKSICSKPNIAAECIAKSCDKSSVKSIENRFKYKLTVPHDENYLEALVLPNNICVLLIPIEFFNNLRQKQRRSLNDVHHENFHLKFLVATDVASGKRKKGASNIRAGDRLIRMVYEFSKDNIVSYSETIEFRTPVGGQLLELNESIIMNTSFMSTNYSSDYDHIGVIYPNTAIPSLDGCRDYSSLMSQLNRC
jgi:hypothetical protein